MGKRTPDAFDSAVQKSNLWLKDVQAEARLADRIQAYSALRAVLHALRDCLPQGGALKLASHLPLLLKGVFFDGWKPAKPLRLDRREFLDRLSRDLRGYRELDPSLALHAVMRALETHVGRAQVASLVFVLPRGVRSLFEESVSQAEGAGTPRAGRRPVAVEPSVSRRARGQAGARARGREKAEPAREKAETAELPGIAPERGLQQEPYGE